MAMAVLRPQDCLSSPHSRQQNYHVAAAGMACRPSSAPRSVKGSQAPLLMRHKMSPFPRNRLSGSLTGVETQIKRFGDGILEQRTNSAGLLPVPHTGSPHPPLSRSSSSNMLSGSAHSSSATKVPFSNSIPSSPSRNMTRNVPKIRSASAMKVPLSSSTHSSSSSPSSSRNVVQNSPSSTQSRRAVSAGLPTLNSRIPPKPGRGNGFMNYVSGPTCATSATVTHTSELPSKFVDGKASCRKQQGLNGSDHIGDICKRTRPDAFFTSAGAPDNARCFFKALPEGGPITGKRSAREVDFRKGRSSPGVRGHAKELGRSSVITILQRPKDTGASQELIASFIQRSDSSSEDSSDRENVEGISVGCTREIFRMDTERSGPRETISFKTKKAHDKLDMLHMVTSSLNSMDSGKDVTMEIQHYFPALTDIERWAGPAFYNSPPPSSLPLPSFPLKQARTHSLDLSGLTAQRSVQAFEKESSTSSSLSSSPSPSMSYSCVWDTASATQDLRRILNLDLCSL